MEQLRQARPRIGPDTSRLPVLGGELLAPGGTIIFRKDNLFGSRHGNQFKILFTMLKFAI